MNQTPDEQEAILAIARRMFVESQLLGHVRERAALLGAYDNGTDIQQYVEAATKEYLKRGEEMPEEGL
jgi:hypothetical protein